MASAEAGIGRLLTASEREIWPEGELRSAFVVVGGFFLTAWHCIEPIGGALAKIWLRLQPRGPAELYFDVPVKYEAHNRLLDAAVLSLDLERLPDVGETHVVDELVDFLDRVALPLSSTVDAFDMVRVGGFPERNPARHPTLFTGRVETADALIGSAFSIRTYVPEFAARYAEWPDGMSGGPLLREFNGVEHVVGVVSSYPKSSSDHGATGGTILCRRIKELSIVFPMIDSATLSASVSHEMGPNQARVYISSYASDLVSYQDAAAEVCQRHGLRPIRSSELSMPPADREREINSCDLFVLMLDENAPADQEFFSELEYRWAASAARPKILVLVKSALGSPAPEGLVSHVLSRHSISRISFSDLDAFRLDLYRLIEAYKPREARKFMWNWAQIRHEPDDRRTLPSPPAMYAIPDYVGGAPFTGRTYELENLESWVSSNDSVMVVEAIGGTGKSALAWEWSKNQRDRFEGTFWWSFYDGFSSMERFLRELLAYLRVQQVAKIKKISREELPDLVLHELRRSPFLVVLDGFERLLLAYHQYDPSKVTDHDVDMDCRGNKHSMIDPLGYEFVRRLAAVSSTKVLITTRMVPDALEGLGGSLLPGVRKYRLPGLTHDDTRLLLARLGVTASFQRQEAFFGPLDNHPLLIAIVAGMVRDNRLAPGRFDDWLAAQSFDIRNVNLTARRRHILATALDGLDSDESRLLSWISALAGSVHWRVIESINPYLKSDEVNAGALLDAALRDLEVRGLIWWNRNSNTYDMHPVVRAFAHERMDGSEKVDANERIRDYFQALPPEELAAANSVEDMQQTISLFRALTGALQHGSAAFVWSNRLADPLMVVLGANATAIELLQPYSTPKVIPLSADLSIALHLSGKHDDGIAIEISILREVLRARDRNEVRTSLGRLATHYRSSGALARYAEVISVLAIDITPEDSMWASLLLHRKILDVVRGSTSSWMSSLVGGSEEFSAGLKLSNPWMRSDITYWELSLRQQTGVLRLDEIESAEKASSNWRNRLRLAIMKFDLLVSAKQYSQAHVVADEIDRLRRVGGQEIVPAENAMILALQSRFNDATAAVAECMSALSRLHEFDRPYLRIAIALRLLDRHEDSLRMAHLARKRAWADGPNLTYYFDFKRAENFLREADVLLDPLPQSSVQDSRFPEQSSVEQLLRSS